MRRFCIMLNPAIQRVYLESNPDIPQKELSAIAHGKNISLNGIEPVDFAGCKSISFSADTLSDEELSYLSTLSGAIAVFEFFEGGMCRPLNIADFHIFPESLVSILKYSGKTNEHFTRLLVNLALSVCDTKSKKRILMCDPMCGHGTTLYEGIIRGFDVIGLEQLASCMPQCKTYITKYFERGKYKHKLSAGKVSENGKKLGEYFDLEFASDKEDYRSDIKQHLRFVNTDTCNILSFSKKTSIDMLICDLPYGVQHASKNAAGLSHSPLALLQKALPFWYAAMKNGASIVLSFNTFTAPKHKLSKLLTDNGFTVMDSEEYSGYEHRVDNAILRDLIAAKK